MRNLKCDDKFERFKKNLEGGKEFERWRRIQKVERILEDENEFGR